MIRAEKIRNALVFCNRKKEVAVLYRSMQSHGFDVAQLHGDMDQSQRTETMDMFRDGRIEILVCSDVAARGLDIQGLSHVFNFDVPMHAEDYIHRIGRTGRAGLPGRAFTLAVPLFITCGLVFLNYLVDLIYGLRGETMPSSRASDTDAH